MPTEIEQMIALLDEWLAMHEDIALEQATEEGVVDEERTQSYLGWVLR